MELDHANAIAISVSQEHVRYPARRVCLSRAGCPLQNEVSLVIQQAKNDVELRLIKIDIGQEICPGILHRCGSGGFFWLSRAFWTRLPLRKRSLAKLGGVDRAGEGLGNAAVD